MYHVNFIHLAIDGILAISLFALFFRTLVTSFANMKTLRNAEYFSGRLALFWSLLSIVSMIVGGIFTAIAFLMIGASRHINKAAAIPVA